MFKNTKNKVAKTVKWYAFISTSLCVLASILIATDGELVFLLGVPASVIVGLFIFSIGEALDLLDQIRQNTAGAKAAGNVASGAYDDLPEL